MKTTCLLLTALLTTGFVAGCGKPKRGPTKTIETAESPPVKEDGTVALPVEYDKLDWKDDVFLYEDKPFSGVAVSKYKNGQMSKRYEFKDGKYHGTTREWYENGERSAMTQFENGKRHGPNVYWDETGKEIKRQKYEHDVVVESTDPTEVEK